MGSFAKALTMGQQENKTMKYGHFTKIAKLKCKKEKMDKM